MTIIDVAIVGLGNRAQEHLATIQRLTAICRLVGVCDVNPEVAAATGERLDVPSFTDLDRMLTEARPTLLYAITPPDSHHAAVELAGRHGVHVISETPIATTLPLADAMIASAKAHNIKLEVSENVWRWPNEQLKKRIIEAGLIGEVTQAHLWYYSGSYHGTSITRTLIGSAPVRVRGYARDTPLPPYTDRHERKHTSGPYEHGLIEFDNGAICVYQYPLHPHDRNYWDIIGTEGAIIGSDLVLVRGGERAVYPIRQEIDDSSGTPTLVRAYVETDPPVVWENPLRDLPTGTGADDIGRADILAGMRRAILDGTDPPYGAANARLDQEILIAIRESARRDGIWIDLPLTGLTEGERSLHEEYTRRYGHDPLGDIGAVIRTLHPRNTPAELALLRYHEEKRTGA